MEVQAVGGVFGHGHADHAPAPAEHEIDRLGGDRLGRTDEVAFVFAFLGVDDDHQPAFFEGGESFLHGMRVIGHGCGYCSIELSTRRNLLRLDWDLL